MRFGEYSTHELDLPPEAYEPHLDVDFTKLSPEKRHDCAPSERGAEAAARACSISASWKWHPIALCQQAVVEIVQDHGSLALRSMIAPISGGTRSGCRPAIHSWRNASCAISPRVPSGRW
jgi:hypothetical protein